MELRRKQEEVEKAKEAKEAANKKEKMRLMKEQVTKKNHSNERTILIHSM
jgi:hypothetical protein